MRLTLTLVAALSLAACATVGKKWDTTHANDVQRGAHDKAQMVAWFGEPTSKVSPLRNSPFGCVERWQWTYAHAVAGGSSMSDVLVVDFDTAGKVCDNAFSQLEQ